MSDIADILGFAGKQNDELFKVSKLSSKPAKKPKGMSREVYDLIGAETLVPSMQPNEILPTFKNKRATVLKGKWIWDVIKNSARNNHQFALHHWVKADMHYPDYPYAKFNVKMENFALSQEEYDSLELGTDLSDVWSYEDTLEVMQMCVRYDLRWPVIYDKIVLSKSRRVEEIQARYYFVVAKLSAAANQLNATSSAAPIEAKSKFNLEMETRRREQQDLLFRK